MALLSISESENWPAFIVVIVVKVFSDPNFSYFYSYFPCWHQSFDNPCFLHPRYTGKMTK